MVWNNVYLTTPNPVGNYQGSAASTVFSDLSVAGSIDADTIDLVGGMQVGSTLTSTDADFLSVNSATDASGMTTGQLRLVFLASGVSLMYSSGESQYEVGSARSQDQT